MCPKCHSNHVIRNGHRLGEHFLARTSLWRTELATQSLPVGDRSLEIFRALWQMIQGWACFLYITDGYPVYPCLIDDCDHLVSIRGDDQSSPQMRGRLAFEDGLLHSAVEGENCRLRHYLARLHRKTLCYSKSVEMLAVSGRLLAYYLKHKQLPPFA